MLQVHLVIIFRKTPSIGISVYYSARSLHLGGMFTKELPKSMTLKLKGGAYVDPESGLEDKAHVYKSGSDLYSVVLGSVDVQEGRNSYYKLQLLQHDTKAHK